MLRAINFRRAAASVALFIAAACAQHSATGEPASGAGVIYLDQGWSQSDRERFYQIPQGSAAVAYDVFLNLEVADGRQLFRSDANSERYGLIVQGANPRSNPDGLPIGVAKTVVAEAPWTGVYAGLTCAVCHSADLFYHGRRIRIDGGTAHAFDLMGYIYALDDALQKTLADAAKFDRLAARMGASSPAAGSELRKRIESDADRVHEYRTRTLVTPWAWGPGRVDAIALIVNRLICVLPEIPQNWSTPQAPTKPPFLWNSPQGKWTQWRGTQQDPINRNLTETMGVFMPMDLKSKTPAQGLFDSNAAIENLEWIEDVLERLAPPKWPEEVLGRIDRAKAAEGKKLFTTNCARCHNQYPYSWTAPNKYGKRFIDVGIIPQKYVGTDPMQFEDLRPYAITAQLSPYLLPEFKGKELVPTGVLYVSLQANILQKALTKITLTDEQQLKLHGYRELPIPRPSSGVYKAAPRDGVWATGPFLHNGSVPNLYEMLIPAKQRTKKFLVGRDFDPVKVGVDTSGKSGAFPMDTSLFGNSNAGHSFEDGPRGNGIIGPLLTDEQRWALVEYLKSIPEEAGRVTPYGGPPNAREGHADWIEQFVGGQ